MKTFYIYLAAAIISAINAFFSFNLGYDWINFGQGLNPAIAFPVAAIMVVTFVFCIRQADKAIMAEGDRFAEHLGGCILDETPSSFVDEARAARQAKQAKWAEQHRFIGYGE